MKRILLVGASTLLLLSACNKGPEIESPIEKVQEIEVPMPVGEIRHPTAGLEQWFAIGPVNGVEGSPANGVAQSHYFEEGLYLHTVQANVAPAPDGSFYEGWISDGSNIVSTGHLTNPMGDSRHSLQFEQNQDYRAYTQVLITVEADDGDPAPGKKVAEAILKVTPR